MKITKLALLTNKIYEFYYVFNNSYRLKIKKTGTQTPVFHPLSDVHLRPCHSAFMDIRNSSLDSVLLRRSIKNSMASMEVMSER